MERMPVWSVLVVLLWAARAAVGDGPPRWEGGGGGVREPAGSVRAVLGERVRGEAGLERCGFRALVELGGIGGVRAAALLEARWRHDPRGGPLAVDAVRGIGPVTSARQIATR